MSGMDDWRKWRDDAAQAVRRGKPVRVIGGTIIIGARVKHYMQRFGYTDGTATVVGFEVSDDGWTKILVKSERPFDSMFLTAGDSAKWDFDRVEVVPGL